jgi:hypothetical protein
MQKSDVTRQRGVMQHSLLNKLSKRVKFSVCLVKHHAAEKNGQGHALNAILDGGEWTVSHPEGRPFRTH